MEWWERAIDTLLVRRPQAHNTNPSKGLVFGERENVGRQKKSEQVIIGKLKIIRHATKTRQSHTIEYRVSNRSSSSAKQNINKSEEPK